jgi:lipopolysaccharide assembly outer membrane protein LptD (OstA)
MNIIIFVLIVINVYGSDKIDSFLAGSVVKSDEWIIDKKKDKEIFKNNVSFKNAIYTMKTDYAVYDRNQKLWFAEGRVYLRRNLNNNSYIESYCDTAKYDENNQKTVMLSKNGSVKTVFFDGIKKEIYTTYSIANEADLRSKTITFEKEFKLITSSLTAISNMAVYYEDTKEFELQKQGQLLGYNNEYLIFFSADRVSINRETKFIRAWDNVYGNIKRR